jgi:hypothetical protein
MKPACIPLPAFLRTSKNLAKKFRGSDLLHKKDEAYKMPPFGNTKS